MNNRCLFIIYNFITLQNKSCAIKWKCIIWTMSENFLSKYPKCYEVNILRHMHDGKLLFRKLDWYKGQVVLIFIFENDGEFRSPMEVCKHLKLICIAKPIVNKPFYPISCKKKLFFFLPKFYFVILKVLYRKCWIFLLAHNRKLTKIGL